MKLLTIPILLCLAVTLWSQGDPVLDRINGDVWKPFARAYSAHDIDAFLDLHAKEAVRLPADNRTVYGMGTYRERMLEGKVWAEKYHRTRMLQLRFTDRFHEGNLAVDRGVYKLTVTQPGKDKAFYYGEFTVVLRLIDGKWKIWMDMDENPEGAVDEEAFRAAKEMEETSVWKGIPDE